MRKLGIQGKREKMQISTVFGEKTQTVYKLDLKVKGLKEAKQFQLKNVYALPSLPDVSGDIAKEGELQNWTHLKDIDIPTLDNLHVDLLIGADNIQCLLVNETRVGKDEQPMGIHTDLGWALSGGIRSGDGGSASVNFTSIGNQLIHNQLERMFSLDFCSEKYTDESDLAHSVDDVRALSKMKSSTKMIDGHYEVALSWRNDRPLLPNNRKLASKRLECLKRKLEKDSELFEKYKDKIDEYLNLGYAKQVPENLQNPQVGEAWYIPHHATMQTKFRVVFDCAARFNNTSLNEQLLKGPDFTNNLVGVLIRFRQDQYAFTCDIKSMFHQINVSPFDSNYLRFLWWPNHDLNCTPVDYQMTVHPFGATSSPSVAGYALRKVAEDNSTDADQIVSKTVQRNFYVDDCLKSMSDIDSTINLIEQLRALFLSGGFFLTKFTSNCRKILFSVPGPDRAVANDVDIMCNELPIGNTLGLVWIPEIDSIKVKVHVKEKPITRRGILSVISQVYDPLGIVQPFILTMKRHLQSLNSENLDWDEPLSLEMQTEWNNWLAVLPSLEELSVPRCYKPSGFIPTRIELHCFSDGSQNGYGAVAYLRMTFSSGEVHCSFVLGKSSVAPRKPMRIPRLELTAAVVAVRLAKFIQRELEYHLDGTTFWSDSTAVLHYIANTTTRYQVFVANRLKIIHDWSKVEDWRYVDSSSNPADLASRGASPNKYGNYEVWFKGPEFLWKKEQFWPSLPLLANMPFNDPETKKINAICNRNEQCNQVNQPCYQDMFSRYSNWHRLVKAVAWILKFKQYMKLKYVLKKDTSLSKQITDTDYQLAITAIIKNTQCLYFSEVLKELQTNKFINAAKRKFRNSSELQALQRLTPFLKDDILRVGGRLQRSHLPEDTVHPIILPSISPVTTLLIQHYHEREGHSGTLHVLSALRERFWILRGHATLRSVLRNCNRCKLLRAKVGDQLEAQLPECRVTPNHPSFYWSGIDYMGPVMIKQGRNILKRYIAVFTCLASRAVHLEVSNSLDTSSFLMAFHRFAARRGRPSVIFSDNGTNFVGAERELKDALKSWDKTVLQKVMLKQQIKWHFNPPAASHQGGVWERVIRTIRKVLSALTMDRILNDKTLHSFIVEVEQIINSRPITPLRSDPADDLPLTPKMLLTGRLQSDLPPGQFIRADGYRKSWKLVQFLADQFWSQWLKLYIPCLQTRHKWFKQKRNLVVGDVVLIADDNTKRSCWPKAVVEETFPDKDDLVRRARVRTACSSLTRDIRKLCLLEGSS